MTIRQEMLKAARRAPQVLGESTPLVESFLLRQQNTDGGFKDRAGKSDLYYTVFGLDALQAVTATPGVSASTDQCVQDAIEGVHRFTAAFGTGAGLDFVHLCCLARCWATLELAGGGAVATQSARRALANTIETFRSNDGGYHPSAGSEFGTAYGAFLAAAAYEDLDETLPERDRLVPSLWALRADDGSFTNLRSSSSSCDVRDRLGSTNATAAAVTTLRHLGRAEPVVAAQWLLARHQVDGGFLAMPNAPIPDLLSTATALHALAGVRTSLDAVRERCLDFVDSLWTNEGGFHGHWRDDKLDCEYTFYGLLALGHLGA